MSAVCMGPPNSLPRALILLPKFDSHSSNAGANGEYPRRGVPPIETLRLGDILPVTKADDDSQDPFHLPDGALAGAGSRINSGARGNAKLPAASSMTLTWHM